MHKLPQQKNSIPSPRKVTPPPYSYSATTTNDPPSSNLTEAPIRHFPTSSNFTTQGLGGGEGVPGGGRGACGPGRGFGGGVGGRAGVGSMWG